MKLRTILAILFLFTVGSALAQTASAPKPLTKVNIEQLLKNDVPSERLADLVNRDGIDFEPTDAFLATLRKEGAKDVLINALGAAKRVGQRSLRSPETAAQVKEHLNRAEQSVINGDHEDVISEGRQAVQIDSRNSEAHATLAVGYLLKGDYETALSECHEAERLDPQNGIAGQLRVGALSKRQAGGSGGGNAPGSGPCPLEPARAFRGRPGRDHLGDSTPWYLRPPEP